MIAKLKNPHFSDDTNVYENAIIIERLSPSSISNSGVT